MVDKYKDENLDSEIAKRLDDLFGEGDISSKDADPFKSDDAISTKDKSQDQENKAGDEDVVELDEAIPDEPVEENIPNDYPLAELKNMVLSIDWEITDEVLAGLVSQIDNLKDTYKNEKIILMFLQLLGSLGEYIKTNRGNAHPKTFKILNSVFSRLEKIVLSKDMAESEKKKILRTEMNKYKKLREEVSKKKASMFSKAKPKPSRKSEAVTTETQKEKAKKQADIVLAQPESKSAVAEPAAAQSYDALVEMVEDLKQFIHSELSALRKELKVLQKSK